MMITSPVNSRPKTISPSPITIPEELITEVLPLLTVKSLLRLKCVSKSWNSLISDPSFVKKHLHKSSQKTDLTLFSAHYSDKSTYTQLTVYPAHCFLKNNTMVPSMIQSSKCFVHEYHEVVGSCNGLCCLLQIECMYGEFSFRLCNPATRSLSHKLASFCSSPEGSNTPFKFSFGYDNFTAKYKVVAFRPNEFRVFTLGVNGWRNIESFPIDPSNFICSRQNHGLYLSNCLIWLADGTRDRNGHSRYLNLEQFVIISFNLGTENYTELLPPQDFDGKFLYMPNICVLMDCLCFYNHCFYNHSDWNNIVIWKMRDFGVEESWTKLFNFSYHDFIHETSWLGYFPLLPLLVLEDGNTLILENFEGQGIRYNRRDSRVDPIRFSDTISWFYDHRYVESLVSIW